MNDLRRFAGWVADNRAGAAQALEAAAGVLEALKPQAAARGMAPIEMITGIPSADRALADAAGLAAIAGRAGANVDLVLSALGMLKRIATGLLL